MELIFNWSTNHCCLVHWHNVSAELCVSYLKTNTYDFLLLDMIWKVLCNDVSIRQQDIADSLEKTKQDNVISKELQTQIHQVCNCISRWKSPWQIFSYSCRRSEGRDIPVCGWFQSSDWAERIRPPQSRRTRRAPMWPGTRERRERTGPAGPSMRGRGVAVLIL